jgi:hypothetical protein
VSPQCPIERDFQSNRTWLSCAHGLIKQRTVETSWRSGTRGQVLVRFAQQWLANFSALVFVIKFGRQLELGYDGPAGNRRTGQVMSSILEVTADDIHSIKSPVFLVDLLRKLLLAEARSHGIARRGVSVPAQITVSDDGEDAIVEWLGGPDSTDYLPARVCMLQSKATNMPRSECEQEVKDKHGNLKLAIRHALEKSGAYVVFSTDKNDKSTKLQCGKRLPPAARLMW